MPDTFTALGFRQYTVTDPVAPPVIIYGFLIVDKDTILPKSKFFARISNENNSDE